jgi:cytochrome c-type biogenesis protein CcsB
MIAVYYLLALSYALATLAFALGILVAWKVSWNVGRGLSLSGVVLVAIGLLIGSGMLAYSWMHTGEPPFQTIYQTLIFLTVTTAVIYLIAGRGIPIIGFATGLFALAILGYAFIKKDADLAQQIPPALQSAWFVPHVVVYFLGYSALFFSFVTAILALVFPDAKELAPGNPLGISERDFNKLTYQWVVFGFVNITVGLAFGAFWAKFAWGDWWTWDPKENWALITWVVYAAYLHLRFVKGVSPRMMAWISIIGFLAVMFTYLGVNYLPEAQKALHSYQQ